MRNVEKHIKFINTSRLFESLNINQEKRGKTGQKVPKLRKNNDFYLKTSQY